MSRSKTALSAIAITSTIAATLTACAPMSASTPAASPAARGTLAKADGTRVGTVSVLPNGSGSLVEIRLSAYTAGTYGAHLHTTGLCEGPAFASAGGHWNPGGHQHGRFNPMGTHLGDLPNIIVGADGTATLSFAIASAPDALFDADGTAVVVHAAVDDERTDPSGNSGARIACAVLVRPT